MVKSTETKFDNIKANNVRMQYVPITYVGWTGYVDYTDAFNRALYNNAIAAQNQFDISVWDIVFYQQVQKLWEIYYGFTTKLNQKELGILNIKIVG